MSTRRAFLHCFSGAILAVAAAGPLAVQAQDKGASERLALQGYDPVAYFKSAKAVPGVAAFELSWDGQRYRFATASNLSLFRADPEKFAPQFGGACAMSMSSGIRREADPHNWVISNGQLFVFAGSGGAERFRKEAAAAAQRADTNWRSMKATATQ